MLHFNLVMNWGVNVTYHLYSPSRRIYNRIQCIHTWYGKSARMSRRFLSNKVTTSWRKQSLRLAASGLAMSEWYASWWWPNLRWWQNTSECNVGKSGSSAEATLIAVFAMLITQSLHLWCSNILITCHPTICSWTFFNGTRENRKFTAKQWHNTNSGNIYW